MRVIDRRDFAQMMGVAEVVINSMRRAGVGPLAYPVRDNILTPDIVRYKYVKSDVRRYLSGYDLQPVSSVNRGFNERMWPCGSIWIVDRAMQKQIRRHDGKVWD